MGLDLQNTRALLAAKNSNPSFDFVGFQGRPSVMISEPEIRKMASEFALLCDIESLVKGVTEQKYAETLLTLFVATQTETLDTSD